MTDEQPTQIEDVPNANLFKILSQLAAVWNLHVVYYTEEDTTVVSGNSDYANTDVVAWGAAICKIGLVYERWSEEENEAMVVLKFQYFIINVLRQLANAWESGDLKIEGFTDEGLLIVSSRESRSAEEQADKDGPGGAD